MFEPMLIYIFSKHLDYTESHGPCCYMLTTRAPYAETGAQTGDICTSPSSIYQATGRLWIPRRCLTRYNPSTAFSLAKSQHLLDIQNLTLEDLAHLADMLACLGPPQPQSKLMKEPAHIIVTSLVQLFWMPYGQHRQHHIKVLFFNQVVHLDTT